MCVYIYIYIYIYMIDDRLCFSGGLDHWPPHVQHSDFAPLGQNPERKSVCA